MSFIIFLETQVPHQLFIYHDQTKIIASLQCLIYFPALLPQYVWKCDFQAPGNASIFCNMDHLSMDLLEWDLKLGSKPGEISKPAGMYYLFMSASGYGEGESVR